MSLFETTYTNRRGDSRPIRIRELNGEYYVNGNDARHFLGLRYITDKVKEFTKGKIKKLCFSTKHSAVSLAIPLPILKRIIDTYAPKIRGIELMNLIEAAIDSEKGMQPLPATKDLMAKHIDHLIAVAQRNVDINERLLEATERLITTYKLAREA